MEKSVTPTTSNFKFYLRVLRLCAVFPYSYKNNLTNFRFETLPLIDKTYATTAPFINCFSLKTKSG